MDFVTKLQIRNGGKTLADLVKQIETKAQEVQLVSAHVDAKKKEIGVLDKEIADKTALLKDIEKRIDLRTAAKEDIDRGITTLRTEAANLQTTVLANREVIAKQNELISDNEKHILETSSRLSTAKAELVVIQRSLYEIAFRVRAANEEKVAIQSEVEAGRLSIEEAARKREEIQSDIETAITNFRVFEERIVQLTNQTGYEISYNKELTKV